MTESDDKLTQAQAALRAFERHRANLYVDLAEIEVEIERAEAEIAELLICENEARPL